MSVLSAVPSWLGLVTACRSESAAGKAGATSAGRHGGQWGNEAAGEGGVWWPQHRREGLAEAACQAGIQAALVRSGISGVLLMFGISAILLIFHDKLSQMGHCQWRRVPKRRCLMLYFGYRKLWK